MWYLRTSINITNANLLPACNDARMSTFLSTALAKSADRINVASDLTPEVATRDNEDTEHFDFEGECLRSRSSDTPFSVKWTCFTFSFMTLMTPPCGQPPCLLIRAASAASALLVMNHHHRHHHHHHWRRHRNNCGKGTGCGALGRSWTGSTVQGGCCRRQRIRAVLLVLLLLLLIQSTL